MKPKQFLSVVCLFLMVGFSGQVGAFDEVQLKKLKALGNCPSCDLSNANLIEARLEGVNLSGANLEWVVDQAIISPKTCPEPVTGFFPLLGSRGVILYFVILYFLNLYYQN